MLRRATAWTAIVLLLFAPVAGWAGPEGERVRRGEADFERDGDHTEITTRTKRTIIEYDRFDIGEQESVHIEQPTRRSRVLNRVLSSDPSAIDGVLTSNGRVWIANPAGVFFGNESIVDVGSLVAGAGEVANRDFRRGRLRVTGLSGDVEVASGATLRASEAVLLAGRTVANYGHIEVPGGMVALLAGDTVELLRPGGGVRVRADAGAAPAGTALVQGGAIEAPGGSVSLVAGDAWSLAMNRDGLTRADRIHVEAGSVDVAGRLDASNASPGAAGGSIRVLGEEVALEEAVLDASGAAGGGEILVGGDYQGGGDVRAAVLTWVGPDSTLRADALEAGDGGRIIVWADEATRFYGELSARGGTGGGDGGFAEISGLYSLVAAGDVDLGAPEGEVGTLLYDPLHIVIVGGTADGTDKKEEADRLRGKKRKGSIRIRFDETGDGDGTTPFEIYESELETTLDSKNIELQAKRSITTQGSFGANDVVIAPGRSLILTLEDDGKELGEPAGIDIRSSDGGDLTWRLSEGGSLTITSEGDPAREGGAGVVVGDVVARTSPDGIPSVVSITVTGRGDVEVGDIDVSGEDAPVDPLGDADPDNDDDRGIGGAGGAVAIEVDRGTLRVGSIAADGGAGRIREASSDAEGSGGAGGLIALSADPYVPGDGEAAGPAMPGPTILVTGDLTARGGEGLVVLSDGVLDFGTRGGAGGRMLVTAGLVAESDDDLGVELQGDLDASAGDGTAGGGSASLGGTSPVSGAATGAMRVEAFGDITVAGLRARGGDAGAAGGFGGFGGNASLASETGAVAVTGDVDLGGGAGFASEVEIEPDGDVRFPGQGGSAGSLVAGVEGDGASLELQGDVFARGGDGTNGAGGAGGNVTLSAADGPISLAAVDLSGGAGSGLALEIDGASNDTGARGGNGGNLIAIAGAVEAGDFDGGDISVGDDVVSLGGAGVDPDGPMDTEDPRENHGVGGLVRLDSARDVLGAGTPRLHAGTVDVVAENFSGFVAAASGDASPDSFEDRASFAASGVGTVQLDQGAGGETAFDFVSAVARGADASLDVDLTGGSAGSTRIVGSGGANVHSVERLESGAGDPHLTYRLVGPPEETADQIDLRTLEVDGGAVDLGPNGGAVANARLDDARPGGERLLGAVMGAPAGASLATEGPLDLVGTRVSDLSVAGSGPDAELLLRVGGEVMGVSAAGVSRVVLEQRRASADAVVGLPGGDGVEIVGTVVDDGASRLESSTVTRVDTVGSGIGFFYDLVDATAAANADRGEPVLTLDADAGSIALGGDGGFAGTGDLVLLTPVDASAGGGLVALIADSNGGGDGTLTPIGAGALDVDGAGALRVRSGGDLGSEADPLRTRSSGPMALAGASEGDFWLVHADGELDIEPVEVEAFGLEAGGGAAVISAPGAIDLENGGRVIRMGVLGEEGPPLHVFSEGGGQRYGGVVLLANPSDVETIDPDTGDEVTERIHEVRLVAGDDVVFEAEVDTDGALPAGEPPGSLEVSTPGRVIFRGDVGSELAGAATLGVLVVDAASFEGDRSVVVESARFRGGVDANGALTLRALGEDSLLRFEGDVGGDSAPTLFDADADLIAFDGAERLRAGEVRLNVESPTAVVPELATVAAAGPLRVESDGDVTLGSGEKLSVRGPLHIRSGGEVALGDVSATEIDVRARRVLLLGRDRGLVQLADGRLRADTGGDWVANSIRTDVAPEWDGVGREPTFAVGDGRLRVPGGPPFRVLLVERRGGEVKASDLAGANGTLDLFGSGGPAVSDPGRDVPRREGLAVAALVPRASDVEPVLPAPPDAGQVLGFVRCADETGGPCDPQAFGAAPGSALASERAREIVRRYHELVASQRGRIELGTAFAPLAGAAEPRRALRRDPALAAARGRLDELAVVLAQVSLLGLPESEAETVRRAVAADFAAATGVEGLDADAVLGAVATRDVGVLP